MFFYVQYIYSPRSNGSPERHTTSRGRTAVPRLLHTAALGMSVEGRGAAVQLSERGPSKGALPGTSCLIVG